jgi:uncharacterized Zn ribbon protein
MEPVILTATGYDWTCPGCGKNNYEGKNKFEVNCPKCKKEWTVVEVKHKGDPDGQLGMVASGQGGVILTACAYSFDCPECKEENFVEKPVGQVKCQSCKYETLVKEVSHCREERKERKPATRIIEKPAYQPDCRQIAMF